MASEIETAIQNELSRNAIRREERKKHTCLQCGHVTKFGEPPHVCRMLVVGGFTPKRKGRKHPHRTTGRHPLNFFC